MIWKSLSITINNNLTPLYSYASPIVTYTSGYKEISGKADLCLEGEDDIEKFHSAIDMKKELETQYIECANGLWYKIEDVFITSFGFNLTPNQSLVDATIEFNAKNAEIAYIDAQFKDEKDKIKIKYENYISVKNEFGDPEEMTYEEFMDKVMVIEL